MLRDDLLAARRLIVDHQFSGVPAYEKEILNPVQQLNEYVMTALRTVEGISVERIVAEWGEAAKERILATAEKHLLSGNLYVQNERLGLTEKGKFLADGIAADLFEV